MSQNLVHSSRYGDDVGDFAPLRNYTTEEVVAIGEWLELPKELTRKVPSDGLQEKTDEDSLGIKYEDINKAIRVPYKLNKSTYEKIEALYQKSLFKMHGADTQVFSKHAKLVYKIKRYLAVCKFTMLHLI